MMKNVFGGRNVGWPLGLLLVITIILAAGCGMRSAGGRTVTVVAPDFFGIGEELAVQLTTGLRQPLGTGGRLIMSTMVDIDDLNRTTRFGRTLTEALATRLFRHGFGVIEVRKASDLLMKSQGGELILTRNANLLAGEHRAVAVVAGTYSLTPDSIIINARLLDAAGNDVLSVAGVEIGRSRAINALLVGGDVVGGGGGGGGNEERLFTLSAYER